MHSFHQSRGRIAFDVLCALAISGSCVGAWMQTGASAMLAAAGVSFLYGLVHLFDMRRPKPALAVQTRTTALSDEDQGDLLKYEPVAVAAPMRVPVAVEEQPEAVVEEPLVIEDVIPASTPPKARKSPKKRSRKAPTLVEDAAPVAVEPVQPAFDEELDHAPVTPLFEPEPFVRQQRAVFGRKAG